MTLSALRVQARRGQRSKTTPRRWEEILRPAGNCLSISSTEARSVVGGVRRTVERDSWPFCGCSTTEEGGRFLADPCCLQSQQLTSRRSFRSYPARSPPRHSCPSCHPSNKSWRRWV